MFKDINYGRYDLKESSKVTNYLDETKKKKKTKKKD